MKIDELYLHLMLYNYHFSLSGHRFLVQATTWFSLSGYTIHIFTSWLWSMHQTKSNRLISKKVLLLNSAWVLYLKKIIHYPSYDTYQPIFIIYSEKNIEKIDIRSSDILYTRFSSILCLLKHVYWLTKKHSIIVLRQKKQIND